MIEIENDIVDVIIWYVVSLVVCFQSHGEV